MPFLEARLLTYALNSLWQVPLIFAAAWLAARLLRRSGPTAEHRVWTTALLLEALLPACTLQPLPALQTLQHWLSLRGQTSLHPGAQVTVSMGPAHAAAGLQLAPALLTAAALLYLTTVLYFAARLCVGLYRTAALRHRAQPLSLTGYASQSYQRYARLFAVHNASVATSSDIATPITLGIRHRLLLLPAQLTAQFTAQLPADLPSEDLDAIFAHEFAHMHRRDFARNLAYEALSLPAAFHPLLWLTRTHLAQTRELVCDALAAESVAGGPRYARSLLRLASKFSELPHPTPPHAIGIFDANHAQNFERRIMNLTHKPIQLKGPRRLATTALSLLLGACACTSALALRMQVAAPAPAPATQTQTVTPTPAPPAQFFLAVPHSTTDAPAKSFKLDIADASTPSPTVKILSPAKLDAQSPPDASTHVSSSVMAGNREAFVPPTYPPEAKAAGIEGSVLLHAIIGKDGKIASLQLISGPAELSKSALDAVKQWTYKPYLLNGNPVAVDTTITVTYSLQK